jgi:excisionase family DNA binding protein
LRLRIDKFTVYRLVAQRKLPAYKVGNQWRFSGKLLGKWLRQNLNIPSTREGSIAVPFRSQDKLG